MSSIAKYATYLTFPRRRSCLGLVRLAPLTATEQ